MTAPPSDESSGPGAAPTPTAVRAALPSTSTASPVPDDPAATDLRASAGALTWNIKDRTPESIAADAGLVRHITRAWAWGGSTGRGVRVCVVDSGVQAGNPLVGPISASYTVMGGQDGGARRAGSAGAGPVVVESEPGDRFGHGTACASIIRRVAPDCELTSLCVIAAGHRAAGTGDALIAGLRWAVRQRFDVVNLSLSTALPQFDRDLRLLADEAYFRGTVLVAAAHNNRIESYPWRYSSVISVGGHGEDDTDLVYANPRPPVEFFARGRAVPVAGLDGELTRTTGNSFASPHVAGRCALILGAHPGLTPFQLKTILYLTCDNVEGAA